jgi:hypothetical protein
MIGVLPYVVSLEGKKLSELLRTVRGFCGIEGFIYYLIPFFIGLQLLALIL